MRLIGYLESAGLAERISRLMGSEGIHHLVEADDGPRWALWVHAEEDLDRAKALFAAFRADPERVAGAATVPVAASAVGDPGRTPSRAAPPVERRSGGGRRVPGWAAGTGTGSQTVAWMVVCVAVAMVTGLTGEHPLVRSLQISEVPYRWGMSAELFLPEARRGEFWRLFTPVLLHFGWPHLLFNMWILWDLGRAVEGRLGPRWLALLVAVLGVVSNLGQYFMSGPRFGGVSGVIYGLLGFVWMMGRYCPRAGLGLHPQMVVMMLVWFVICLSGALGVPVANTAHGVGLVAGVLWGRWMAARWS
ncbi:MAG: rhomboid family intramembrane serine protease [Verrucomicrobiae bacterium]|nr:rhomboid family intramembrane serine protease [Verrucomicrobiae bacterium]